MLSLTCLYQQLRCTCSNFHFKLWCRHQRISKKSFINRIFLWLFKLVRTFSNSLLIETFYFSFQIQDLPRVDLVHTVTQCVRKWRFFSIMWFLKTSQNFIGLYSCIVLPFSWRYLCFCVSKIQLRIDTYILATFLWVLLRILLRILLRPRFKYPSHF
jgi:hypothetical protein